MARDKFTTEEEFERARYLLSPRLGESAPMATGQDDTGFFIEPPIRRSYRILIRRNGLEFQCRNNLLSLDSTTLFSCLNLFPWAKFRRAKGGINFKLDDHQFAATAELSNESRHSVLCRLAKSLSARARTDLAPALDRADDLEPVGHPAADVVEMKAGALGVAVGVEVADQRAVVGALGLRQSEMNAADL